MSESGYDESRGSWLSEGCYFPVDLLEPGEAAAVVAQVRRYRSITERFGGRFGQRWDSPKIHLVAPWADRLVRDQRILDLVTALIGPDLLVWSTNVFWRRGHSAEALAWHQDALHYGWADAAGRTVRLWLALTETTVANGTMLFLPGPHNRSLLPHRMAADAEAWLRGLEVDMDVDETAAVAVRLRAGQGSLHHGTTVHSSGPSTADAGRICFAVDYITPRVRPEPGPDSAMLVHGQDTAGHYILEGAPREEFGSVELEQFRQAIAIRDRRLLARMTAVRLG